MTSVEDSSASYMCQIDDTSDYKNQITDFSKDDNCQSNDDENNALKNESEFYTNGQEDQENNFSNNINNEIEDNINTQSNDNDGNNQNDENKMNRINQNMEPEQFRKVFIGGLSYKTDDETLKNYFLKYGELVDYVVMKDGQTGRSRGFGFVTYSDSFMVDELMKNRPHIIDGRQVEPKRATPREDSGKTEVQMTVKKLFIGGLRDNITEDDLKRYFGNYGTIVEAVVMKEKESSKSRGFGFVTFDDYDPVDKIILEKNHVINGVNVHTQKALPKDFEKGGQINNNNNNGNNRQGNRNNNFSNDNFNYNNQGNNFNTGYNNSNSNGYQNKGQFSKGNGSMVGIQSNQFDNGFSNSSLNNTYGSYNQAPNQPKMNAGGPNMPMMNNRMAGGNMGSNKMGGGPGPMRGGGRFTNRSSGPYGGSGFNNNNGNNFNNNRGGRGSGGRGVGQRRGGFPRQNNGNNNNSGGNGNI